MPPVTPTSELPRTVSASVVALLREDIVSGRLPPGSRLRQVELATRFAVSTTPVREALATLQQEGLVRLHPQRGAVVFVPTLEDLTEHYAIRAALEALAAETTARRFHPSWAPPLEALLDEMRSGPAADRYIALNQEFHAGLYAHSGMPKLVELIVSHREASSAYLRIYRARPDFPVRRLDAEHRAILDACVRRDPQAAARAVRDHLDRTVQHVTATLGGGAPGPVTDEPRRALEPA